MENQNLLNLTLEEIIGMVKEIAGCLSCTHLLKLDNDGSTAYACAKWPDKVRNHTYYLEQGAAATCEDYTTSGSLDTLEQLLNAREKAKKSDD